MKNKITQVQSVPKLDINRYAGRWYEIASYPKWFERDLSNVQAHYTLNRKGYVDILNSGIKNGKQHQARGKAKVTERASGSKLRVSFFWPIYSPYWVIGLGDDYDWAVVSDPQRRSLWILSRTPSLDEQLYANILALISAQNYDLSKLVKMAHN